MADLIATMVVFLLVLTPFAVAGLVIYLILTQGKKQAAAFNAAIANDDDVVGLEVKGFLATASLRTKRAPIVTVTAAGGGKNDPRRWDITANVARVGARTSLKLSHESPLKGLLALVGVKDMRTGDAAFDDAFAIQATDPDAARGILASDDVRAAFRAFFAMRGWTFALSGAQGVVQARMRREDVDARKAREIALVVQRLVHVLEQHADDPPLHEPIDSNAGGSSTGAPVGVPLGT